MNNLLMKCSCCGTVYRIIKTNDERTCMITDFGDSLPIEEELTVSCLKCNYPIEILENTIITEDWIADLFYKVKGN